MQYHSKKGWINSLDQNDYIEKLEELDVGYANDDTELSKLETKSVMENWRAPVD